MGIPKEISEITVGTKTRIHVQQKHRQVPLCILCAVSGAHELHGPFPGILNKHNYIVEALCYKPEVHGFNSRDHWNFQLT
jgi:hypothetical protein